MHKVIQEQQRFVPHEEPKIQDKFGGKPPGYYKHAMYVTVYYEHKGLFIADLWRGDLRAWNALTVEDQKAFIKPLLSRLWKATRPRVPR